MIINWDILKKSVLGTLNLRERQMLERWLDESERHRDFYETVRKHYAEPVGKLEFSDGELDASWQRFTQRAKRKKRPVDTTPRGGGLRGRSRRNPRHLDAEPPGIHDPGRTVGPAHHGRNHAGDTLRRRRGANPVKRQGAGQRMAEIRRRRGSTRPGRGRRQHSARPRTDPDRDPQRRRIPPAAAGRNDGMAQRGNRDRLSVGVRGRRPRRNSQRRGFFSTWRTILRNPSRSPLRTGSKSRCSEPVST